MIDWLIDEIVLKYTLTGGDMGDRGTRLTEEQQS